jgi:site-specific DNA recombinase
MNEQQKSVRCAIYTRKSSEEGLDQSFNSLDAQRAACESYIASQRHQGWSVIPDRYDDGGYSGGSMDRPALKQLLEDIARNKIDTIVVYKIDRLTRSLMDFAKIVEVLDAKQVSFVSITQHFNTTTSMGRLILNILLSFAQFEREVTGERIRDKIAASKRKGMWMGGNVPVGYDVKNRKLIVNPQEANLVRDLFRRYLELGCVSRLKVSLDREGMKSKIRRSVSGRSSGGQSYSRGALYKILNNPVYRGQISHKGQCHAGEHEAIVQQELWDQVQARLRSDHQGRRNGIRSNSLNLLIGVLQDEKGNCFTPSHTVKNGRRYRYYVCRSAIDGTGPVRLPAGEIEALVLSGLQRLLLSSHQVMDRIGMPEDSAPVTEKLLASARETAKQLELGNPATISELAKRALQGVTVCPDKVEVVLRKEILRQIILKDRPGSNPESAGTPTSFEFPARLKRSGREVRLLLAPDSEAHTVSRESTALLKAVARAHDWYQQIINGEASGPGSIAKKIGMDERYVRHMFRFAFLAPDIVEAIVGGRQPHDLTLQKLKRSFPMDWTEQRNLLLRTLRK